jgi:hypothetical protein
MDIIPINRDGVGIARKGEKNYARFNISHATWIQLQSKMNLCDKMKHTFENGSILIFRKNMCKFTGVSKGRTVFIVRCSKDTMYEAMSRAGRYARDIP